MKRELIFMMLLVCSIAKATEIYQYKTYYYEKVASIDENRKRTPQSGDGQFYTFTEQSCYESDKNGISEDLGTATFVNYANNIYVYRGKGYYGDADYFVTDDYETLNIKTTEGTIYVLKRKEAPDSFIASEHKRIKTEIEILAGGGSYPVPQPPIPPIDNDTPPTSHRRCRGCGGSGWCTMCRGKGWYKNMYDGKIYDCSSCGRSGRCRVCHGKGHCN